MGNTFTTSTASASSSEKLDAVNQMLSRVGYPPVAALDTDAPSLAGAAEHHLDTVDDEIQSNGWYFNTRIKTLSPDSGTSKIALPSGTIYAIDTYGADRNTQVIPVSGFLYDLDENQDTFDDDLKVIYWFRVTKWSDIPVAFRNWMIAEATILHARRDARTNLRSERRDMLDELYNERNRYRGEAQRADNQQRDLNLLDTAAIRRIKGKRYTYQSTSHF